MNKLKTAKPQTNVEKVQIFKSTEQTEKEKQQDVHRAVNSCAHKESIHAHTIPQARTEAVFFYLCMDTPIFSLFSMCGANKFISSPLSGVSCCS